MPVLKKQTGDVRSRRDIRKECGLDIVAEQQENKEALREEEEKFLWKGKAN